MKRTRAERRRAALKGIRRAKAAARERSERVRRSWKVRRKRYGPSGRKKKRGGAPPIPPKKTREYFVVVLFETRKHGKNFQRRLPEAILTLKDGATEDEIKEAYANWLLENTKWKAQDIHVLIWASNRGRRVEHKIVPRDEPGSSEPAGAVRLNDTRQKWGPDGKERKGAARRKRKGKKA